MATRALCCVSARAAPYAHARWPSSSSVTTAAATSPNVTRATRSSARVTRAASSATLPASMSNKSDGDSACDECQQPPFGEGTSADGRSLLAPRPRALEGRGGAEHERVGEAATHDLQSDWQSVLRESRSEERRVEKECICLGSRL